MPGQGAPSSGCAFFRKMDGFGGLSEGVSRDLEAPCPSLKALQPSVLPTNPTAAPPPPHYLLMAHSRSRDRGSGFSLPSPSPPAPTLIWGSPPVPQPGACPAAVGHPSGGCRSPASPRPGVGCGLHLGCSAARED